MPRRPELPVKLYYRIGEVAEVVGVEPHVLRYWESEFKSIRPQKSPKGQRVYSRRDLEKLLRVKDLLYTEGYTIAGAKRQLKEGGDKRDGTASEERLHKVHRELSDLRCQVQSALADLERED